MKYDIVELVDFLNRVTDSIINDNGQERLTVLVNQSFAEAAKDQAMIRELLDSVNSLKTEVQKAYDIRRHSILPGIMERDDIENGKVSGVGSVSLQTDLHTSIKAGMKAEVFEWLDDNGHGSLIQPTINSSSLKAFIKGEIKKGEEIPEELFNVAVFTRAQIRKG